MASGQRGSQVAATMVAGKREHGMPRSSLVHAAKRLCKLMRAPAHLGLHLHKALPVTATLVTDVCKRAFEKECMLEHKSLQAPSQALTGSASAFTSQPLDLFVPCLQSR